VHRLIQINIGLCSDGLMNLCQRAPYARKQGGGLIPDVRNMKRRSPLVPISEDGGHRAAVFIWGERSASRRGGGVNMKWNVHYVDRGTGLNIGSRDFVSRDQALIQACAFLQAGHEVQTITGSSGETIEIAAIKEWCRENPDKLRR
jgi:hypothetical protein